MLVSLVYLGKCIDKHFAYTYRATSYAYFKTKERKKEVSKEQPNISL